MSKLTEHLARIEKAKKDNRKDVTTRKDYNIHDDVHNQLDCDSVTKASGKRFYTIGNISLPSVTTVLGGTKDQRDIDSIAKWKRDVGEEEAARVLRDAVNRGNWLHSQTEHYILDSPKFKLPLPNTNFYALWKQMHGMLQRVDNIRCIEGALFSEKLGLAGRVDCVADFDGELSIIDFKTTKKPKEEAWITEYFLQETAYALMFSEMHGVKVKQIVTLMACDGDFKGGGQVFVKRAKDYVAPFIDRLVEFKAKG